MSTFAGKLEAFLQNYDELKSVENEEAFLKEFMGLKAQSAQYREQNIYPADSGQLPVNRKKNRFKDIIPFEYTRVSLHAIEGVDGSDYVNANYIQGVDGSVTYIAAQGPLPHTVGDFWRMIWYHNIEIVLMACKQVEMAKPKCECYWPALNETKSYGPITVSTTREDVNDEFIIRDFVAECEGEKQQIRQYHYSSWPDHGRPDHPQPVIRMIEMMHSYRKRLDVPIVVHCSAGCGRTGTIIAIDIARSMVLSKNIPNKFSPHEIVENMRKQRPAMVQAKEQYVFVFMAMAELGTKALKEKPKTKTESGDDDSVNYENVTTSGTPVPLPRNTSSSKKIKLSPQPEEEGEGEGEKVSPVAPPRTHQGYENFPPNDHVKKNDKPSPPLKPKPRSHANAEGTNGPGTGGSGKPMKPVPPPKQQAPPTTGESEESQYSVVDMSHLKDKGPEIAVVNEHGKVAPLTRVEEELDRHGAIANTSRSILETIIDEVGDLLSDEEEETHPSPPTPPPPHTTTDNTHKWSEFEDEIPPPIPLHTEASKHILEPAGSSAAVTDPDHVTIDSGIYYTPTPHSIPMPGGVASPTSVTPPSTSSPQRTPAGASATLPVADSNHSSGPSGKGSSKLKIFKNFGKSKSEKRKITVNDISKPSGMPRSPSDHALSSPSRGNSPSPDHAVSTRSYTTDLTQLTPANNRYTFPGEMGFGLRIPRPKGPRPEPPHWNVIRNNITAI